MRWVYSRSIIDFIATQSSYFGQASSSVFGAVGVDKSFFAQRGKALVRANAGNESLLGIETQGNHRALCLAQQADGFLKDWPASQSYSPLKVGEFMQGLINELQARMSNPRP